MQKLLQSFVPCADEVWHLQNVDDPECRLFRGFAELGHYGGRPGTRQGLYAATPSGRFLASINSVSANDVAEMLRRALERWRKMPRSERLRSDDPSRAKSELQRLEASYPEDGLVLAAFSRDLPRDDLPDDWRGSAWNQDFVWFTREEAQSLLPSRVEKGVVADWPARLASRLVRFNLVDNVRGQTDAYRTEHIVEATLRTRVESVRRGKARFSFEGRTRAETKGDRPLELSHSVNDSNPVRGVETRILGKSTYDIASRRFDEFELVAAGTRWGQTQYNFRGDDLERAPIGFAFRLAGDSPSERVAPAYVWAYND